MRWLVRSLIVWAVTLPLFYLFGLPYLLTKLEAKTRADAFAQCQTHLKTQHMAYVPAALISPTRADHYCHCISDPITFTQADIIELAKKKKPERLNNALKPVIEACNQSLQDDMSKTINAGPQPRSTFDEHGVETVHFN